MVTQTLCLVYHVTSHHLPLSNAVLAGRLVVIAYTTLCNLTELHQDSR
jgi:hypothetical protein